MRFDTEPGVEQAKQVHVVILFHMSRECIPAVHAKTGPYVPTERDMRHSGGLNDCAGHRPRNLVAASVGQNPPLAALLHFFTWPARNSLILQCLCKCT
jgi:hypothetical protein